MPREYKYRINIRDVDFSRRASLTSMCDYILQAASEDATSIGAGIEFLYSKSLAWVIMRMSIKMERYPNQLENITISTWVESIDKLMVRRNMTIYGEDNEIIGNAITYWCIINFKTRVSDDCRQFSDFFSTIEPIPSAISSPQRIRAFDGDVIASHRVKYSHIDFNEHTSTTKYISWMMNAIDYNKIKTQTPNALDMNFLNESRYNDLVNIICKEESDSISFHLTDNDTSKSICTAKITFEQKK